jgi:hypothetical protein
MTLLWPCKESHKLSTSYLPQNKFVVVSFCGVGEEVTEEIASFE